MWPEYVIYWVIFFPPKIFSQFEKPFKFRVFCDLHFFIDNDCFPPSAELNEFFFIDNNANNASICVRDIPLKRTTASWWTIIYLHFRIRLSFGGSFRGRISGGGLPVWETVHATTAESPGLMYQGTLGEVVGRESELRSFVLGGGGGGVRTW